MTFRLLCQLLIVWFPAVATAAVPSSPSLWQRFYDYWIDGASVTLGVGVAEASATITRISDHATGKLVHRVEDAYFFSYRTKPNYINASDFGYSWMLNLSGFYLDKQQVGKNTYVDLGTGMRGMFAYLVPTLFYNWGNKYDGSFVRAGVGLGLGLAEFNGDIILTDSTIPNDRITIHHGMSNLHAAVSVMLEFRKNNWGLRITSAGPTFDENGYNIALGDSSVNLGYSYYF